MNVSKNRNNVFWCLFLMSVFKQTHNGLALGAVADFGAQNFQSTTKFDAR